MAHTERIPPRLAEKIKGRTIVTVLISRPLQKDQSLIDFCDKNPVFTETNSLEMALSSYGHSQMLERNGVMVGIREFQNPLDSRAPAEYRMAYVHKDGNCSYDLVRFDIKDGSS